MNQSHLAERETQVPLMAEIHTAADTVYAWLGESNGNAEEEVEMLALLQDRRHVCTRGGKEFPTSFGFKVLLHFCERVYSDPWT